MVKQSEGSRLTSFFKSEYHRLVGYVRGRVDRLAARDAEDIVQEVAVNLFQRADITAPVENLSAYVYRALRNEIVDAFRSRRDTVSLDQNVKGQESLTLMDMIGDNTDSGSLELSQQEILQTLYHYLDNLAEDEKALIIATEIEGYSFRYLAERWQVSINTLLSRKSRAMKKLQQMAYDSHVQ